MNKERAREELRDRKILAEIEYNQSEDTKKKDNLLRYIQALDIAIEGLQEDKFVLLQCTDGRIFVVDSKKSIDDLESESCKKCKRIDELKEIRMETKIFTENYFKELEPYERKE